MLLQQIVPNPPPIHVETAPLVPYGVLGLPWEAWLGIVVAFVLVAIVLGVALRMRRQIRAIQQLAKGFDEPRPREREPETIPDEPKAKPILAPGEKFVFDAPGKGARIEAAPGADAIPGRTLAEGLGRTREGFVGRIRSMVSGRTIDEGVVEELEEILFTSDLGVKTANTLLEDLRARVRRKETTDIAALTVLLKADLRARLGDAPPAPTFVDSGVLPYVVMVVGVNGVGKTTTIGKLAKQIVDGRFGPGGRKVVLGAGDTFRAAAAEQLEIWGQRAGVDVISNKEGTDPSAVAFDAARAALARKADVLIVDTAGRLHTKTNLMEELKKVKRILGREIPNAPHEILLVVDATTGQNALNQAKEFNDGVGVTGIVLTKLDGTAKGGIVVGIRDELKIPIRFIGIGEGVDDLRTFDPDAFVDALFA